MLLAVLTDYVDRLWAGLKVSGGQAAEKAPKSTFCLVLLPTVVSMLLGAKLVMDRWASPLAVLILVLAVLVSDVISVMRCSRVKLAVAMFPSDHHESLSFLALTSVGT